MYLAYFHRLLDTEIFMVRGPFYMLPAKIKRA